MDEATGSEAGIDVSELMAEIRGGIEERRLRGDVYEDEVEPVAIRRLRRVFGEVSERQGAVSELFTPDREWNVEPECEMRSHRRRVGRVLVVLKRIFLRPLVKWMLDWAEVNFGRQKRLNERLLTTILDLGSQVARLEVRNRRLEQHCRELAAALERLEDGRPLPPPDGKDMKVR